MGQSLLIDPFIEGKRGDAQHLISSWFAKGFSWFRPTEFFDFIPSIVREKFVKSKAEEKGGEIPAENHAEQLYHKRGTSSFKQIFGKDGSLLNERHPSLSSLIMAMNSKRMNPLGAKRRTVL